MNLDNMGLVLTSSNKNKNGLILEEFNINSSNYSVFNTLLLTKDDVLNVLWIENLTKNTENEIKGLGRKGIKEIIDLAIKRGLKYIDFDILETEIGFYDKIKDELILNKNIKDIYFMKSNTNSKIMRIVI